MGPSFGGSNIGCDGQEKVLAVWEYEGGAPSTRAALYKSKADGRNRVTRGCALPANDRVA
jgi:hypothetical protein